MKKAFIFTLFLTMTLSRTAFPEEIKLIASETAEEMAAEAQIYKFPEIKPEYSLETGYRLVNLKGSSKADEYEYLHDSILLSGEFVAYPFPHRIHFDFEGINRKDYLGDISYSYRDTVLFRGIMRAMFHNLDNFTLIDLDPATQSPAVTRLDDPSHNYGIRTGMNSLFLRFKTPDFPLHVYIDGKFINKEGDMQQRFMAGSGFFNNQNRASERRTVDWDTQDVTVGANSHLGPVELDVSHTEKRFDSDGDRMPAFNYADAGPMRPAGAFPHNLIPDLKGSANTVKLHTSYTGKLVASTTFTWLDRENKDSGAKADYFTGAGDIMWMPATKLTVFFKYRRKETDMENPDALSAGHLGFPSYTSDTAVSRDSISSTTDIFSGDVRYRASKALALGLRYTYKETDRANAEDWEVKDSTTENNFLLSASAKLPMSLKVRANYRHKDLSSPAYNTDPDSSDSVMLSMTWTKIKSLTAFLSYFITSEERDEIRFAGKLPFTDARNRDAQRQRLMGSLTVAAFKDVSLTAGYSYILNRVEQDLIYNSSTPPAEFLDRDVLYKDTAHNYTASINYIPKKNMSLSAEVSHTKSRGNFHPGIQEAISPISIASLSELKLRETIYLIRGDYGLKGGWSVGVRYKYTNFNDLIENPDNPEVSDGNANVVLLTISKRW